MLQKVCEAVLPESSSCISIQQTYPNEAHGSQSTAPLEKKVHVCIFVFAEFEHSTIKFHPAAL